MNNGQASPSFTRLAIFVVILAGLTTSPLLAQPAQPPPVADDWSRIVPGDARFYVELRDLAAIRTLWQGIGIWQTVRELAERDTHSTSRPWQRRAEELLGLGPEDAISRLLGRRSALVASDSSQWNGGVVIAELESSPDLDPFLKQWEAKQLAEEGPVKRYQLGGGLLLAVLDRTLVLGPADDPDGLWGRTVLLLAGRRGPSLAARSDFSALRSRVSTHPQCLLYSAWRRGDPGAFDGCTRLLVAAQVTPSEINCELHGQRSAARSDEFTLSASDLASLPADTLGVWAGPVDFQDIARRNAEGRFGAPESLAGIFFDILTVTGTRTNSLIDQLGPTCLIVFTLDPAAADTGFDLPAFAVLIKTKKKGEIVEYLDGLFGLLSAALHAAAAPPGEPAPEIVVRKSRYEDVDLHSVPIGGALARRLKLDFFNKVEVAWAQVDDTLVLSTSRSHAEQIIRARRGKAARLENAPDAGGILPPAGAGEDLAECFYLRGSDLSAMLTHWLEYLDQRRPQALRPEWWRSWADDRLHQRDKLGVALQADPHHPHRAIVLEINEGSPAAGRLRPGDIITGAAGSPIATTQPAQEVARRYQERGSASEFSLDVLREDKPERVTIPVSPVPALGLAGFDPVGAVRQIATLSRHAEAVTLWRYASRKDRLDARVRIRWQKPAR